MKRVRIFPKKIPTAPGDRYANFAGKIYDGPPSAGYFSAEGCFGSSWFLGGSDRVPGRGGGV
jgi:hypothetical protein